MYSATPAEPTIDRPGSIVNLGSGSPCAASQTALASVWVTIWVGMGSSSTVYGTPKPPTGAELVQLEAKRSLESRGHLENTLDGQSVRIELEELRANMRMQAYQIESRRVVDDLRRGLGRPGLDAQPELGVERTRGDMRVGVDVNPGRHAQEHRLLEPTLDRQPRDAADLLEIGVASLGHRRKLLRAIADLKVVEKSEPDVAVAAVAPAGPRPQDSAERRQVTVMFSDLVGSTALSASMDPEDLREVISAYQKCVDETVRRYGGFVAKYMGDGVLIYFGYPQAHEDDAERAVRAGLKLVAAVGALKTHAVLQTRLGIATGLVVVGDLIGSGASQEQGIVGETPNLAARLQGVAKPNSVVIAESTRRLVGNLFELEDLGAQDLKGISGSVRAWAALRQAFVESRFEAMHTSGLTELVGREEELDLLLRRWSKAKGGQGQVVLLSGEPGIGKSRLTAALLERLAGEPHTRLRYFCSQQHIDSALYPIISQMERAAGFAHDDTAQAKLDKLDAVLAQSFTPRQDAALLSDMLSLPNDGRYPTLELTAQQRRQKTRSMH